MGENLNQLERDVEAARVRLASDLSRLTSPQTLHGFQSDIKREAFGMKDAVIESAKSSVQSTLQGVVDDIKARAAANPAAALAIGAGIAWRLIQRPPIATALVGAGVWSLMRTPPVQTYGDPDFDYVQRGKERLQEQAGAVADQVKERALEFAQTAKEQASDFAHTAAEHASELAQTAQERTVELAAAARDRTQRFAADAAAATHQMASDVRQQAAGHVADTVEVITQRTLAANQRVAETSREAANQASAYVRHAADVPHRFAAQTHQSLGDPEIRDKVLLGAAGLAVAMALGIAFQRRVAEDAAAE
jgi:hypothetical protein